MGIDNYFSNLKLYESKLDLTKLLINIPDYRSMLAPYQDLIVFEKDESDEKKSDEGNSNL